MTSRRREWGRSLGSIGTLGQAVQGIAGLVPRFTLWKQMRASLPNLERAADGARLAMVLRMARQEDSAVFLWEARRLARRLGVPDPPEVQRYLDETAERLVQFVREGGDRTGLAKPLQLTDAALAGRGKASGRGSPLSRYRDFSDQLDVAQHVAALHASGLSLNKAYDQAAEELPVSRDTAKRHYRRHRRLLETPLEEAATWVRNSPDC